jgi:hypothetical protein
MGSPHRMWQAAHRMPVKDPVSEVKGLWFVVGRRYVLEHYGQPTLDACVARLGGHGHVLAEPIASEWYAEEALQQTLAVLDVVVAGGDQDAFVQILLECSLLAVNHFFRALLRLVPPATMLRKIPTMWTLIRRGSGRVVVDADETRSVIRYSEFPYFDDVHYRLLTLAAVRSLMVLCGARHARVDLAEYSPDTLTVHVSY